MITGFNTDIKFDGVTYHVQTEDKGLRTPLILSLVYQGGTILASKRSPYEDLLSGEFDEKVLEERLNRQHNLICAAIRAGRIEDLKRMTKTNLPEAENGLFVTKEIKKEKVEPPEKIAEQVQEKVTVPAKISDDTPELQIAEAENTGQSPQLESEKPKPITQEKSDKKIPADITRLEVDVVEIQTPTEKVVWDIPVVEDVIVLDDSHIETTEIFDVEEIILPSDAVEIIGDLEQFESLLEDELKVKLLGENKFKSGDNKHITIFVCRGKKEKSVSDASIMVKIIGSDFRPLIYHAKADNNGTATVFLKLPTFRSGRAAVLVRAIIDGEEAELRRAITPE